MIHKMSYAQHYFFVEAEGGQAYYMKIYDTLYSSTGEGFLIIPKVSDNKVSFTIGFPKGVFPEIKFELSGMDHDRGFLLKHNSNNSWVIIDRQTQEQFQGNGNGTALNVAKENISEKPAVSADFANMLAEVTSDKTLINPAPVAVKMETIKKDSTINLQKKEVISDSLSPSPAFQIERFNPVLSQKSESRSDQKLQIVYEDQFAKGRIDTIQVIIDLPVAPKVTETLKIMESVKPVANETNTDISCILPEATAKDLRTIQKKLLGLETETEQLDHILKMYKSRCFTVEQTKEIGWFFRDEVLRLKMFERILPLLRDKTNVADLGVAFFKEENVRAFKALIAH